MDLRSVIDNSSTAESTAASSLLSKPFEPGFSQKRSRVSSNVPSPPYDIAKVRGRARRARRAPRGACFTR